MWRASHETVRQTQKTNKPCSLGVIPEANAEFVCQMEDVIDMTLITRSFVSMRVTSNC